MIDKPQVKIFLGKVWMGDADDILRYNINIWKSSQWATWLCVNNE